jgi:beta-mannanase
MKLHVTAIAAVLLIAVGDSAAATPSSQQLLAQAAAGGTSAHLFGLSPARDSTIPAERKEAAGAGHALNIINLFVDWNTSAATMTSRWKSASAGGAVPELTWMPCSFTAGCTPAHNPYPLRDIAAGTYDSYITSIADAAKAFGAPVIMRFAHEMNANWYPWGSVNGNTPAQYIAAWRHVVHIFNARGAANAEWLWTPNKHGPKSGGSCNLCAWYPGDSYVTFTGVDGYNGPQYSRVWTWPSQCSARHLSSSRRSPPGR